MFKKLITFPCGKKNLMLLKKEEGKRALKITLGCGNLLSASIRHGIYSSSCSAMYSISALPPSNLK